MIFKSRSSVHDYGQRNRFNLLSTFYHVIYRLKKKKMSSEISSDLSKSVSLLEDSQKRQNEEVIRGWGAWLSQLLRSLSTDAGGGPGAGGLHLKSADGTHLVPGSSTEKSLSIMIWKASVIVPFASNIFRYLHTCVCVCVCVCESLNRVRLYATPWTVVHQAPLSMEFSRQEY